LEDYKDDSRQAVGPKEQVAVLRVENHQIVGENVKQTPSPNVGGPFTRPHPDTIVIHFTDGHNLEAAVDTLCDTDRKVSAHLVVGRDGALVQLVPFDQVAWHAGQSNWGERTQLNQHALGIEVQNAGRLRRHNDCFVSSLGQEYPDYEVCEAVHRNQVDPSYWHTYPQAQLEVIEHVCRVLVETYGIRHILGHEEIAPQRKIDPGPAFPLDRLRHELLYQDTHVA
jgi:N-acetylmuramoyl-L-alanine amidase